MVTGMKENVNKTEYMRSERRIQNNRIRRQREMRKHFWIFVVTLCLIATCSITVSGLKANAQDESVRTSYKYYKSIVVSNQDTLWSIAETYMDTEHYSSINDYIKEVMRLNSLSDDTINYGRHLIIPYYDDYKEEASDVATDFAG